MNARTVFRLPAPGLPTLTPSNQHPNRRRNRRLLAGFALFAALVTPNFATARGTDLRIADIIFFRAGPPEESNAKTKAPLALIPAHLAIAEAQDRPSPDGDPAAQESDQTAFSEELGLPSPIWGRTAGDNSVAGFTFGTNVSTLGVGAEVGYRFNDYIAVRVVGSYFQDDLALEYAGLGYDVDYTLLSAGAVVDLYPFGRIFRLTGGLRYNLNSADIEFTPKDDMNFGGVKVTPEQVGKFQGDVTFRRYAPYVGLGFAGSFWEQSLLLSADLGVFFQGSPEIELQGGDIIEKDPRAREALDQELADIEDDFSYLGFYPVLLLSATYRF